MRRLRTAPIVIILVLAVTALSSASLFSGNTRDTFDDPGAAPWAAFLLNYTMMATMTAPILVGVLASRQTDIEHSGSGWILAATAGLPPGFLCRAKLAALSVILFPAVILQSLLVIAAGTLIGMRVPPDLGPWIGYTFLLFLVDVAFCALHIWLAATVDNQLLSVGTGVLGAFLAVFMLLVPGTVARFLPWGYYAVISNASQVSGGVAYTSPPYPWITGFLLLVGVVFATTTRHQDHIER